VEKKEPRNITKGRKNRVEKQHATHIKTKNKDFT
jgi:hypothetical protein